jgi:hypothetical protein
MKGGVSMYQNEVRLVQATPASMYQREVKTSLIGTCQNQDKKRGKRYIEEEGID